MSFSYNEELSDVGNAEIISSVRFILQDTIQDEAEFSDEEITAQTTDINTELSQKSRNLTVALTLARALTRKFGRQASFTSGKTQIDALGRAKYWRTIEKDLESDLQLALLADGAGLGGVLYAGRTSTYWGDNSPLGGYFVN